MHFREGLSFITEEKEMNGISYFIVEVVNNGEKVYVPKEKADAIIRPLFDKKELDELLDFMKPIRPDYFNNTKQRRDVFKKKIGSGDIKDLAYLTMQLYYFNHPDEVDTPVKFGPADVDMLKYAARTMFDELALALNIDRDKVEEDIYKKMKER
ncbi:MAG: hypothetical protein K5906_00850 [Bacilli bacterium]|nr:hypothetical protein [Bacilli bacterium]